jgi:acetyl esterase/lipase
VHIPTIARAWVRVTSSVIVAVAATLLLAAGRADALLSPNNEYHTPSGAYAAQRPVGWVLLIHGGGWQVTGKAPVAATRPEADFFRSHGWGTYNIDYRPGTRSLTDVLSAYDALRRRVGPAAPVCAWGGSAGGHLALLLAGYRSTVACVISEAGPTDLVNYASQPAWAPPGVPPDTGPAWITRTFIVPSFGASVGALWHWSPVRLGARIRAHLLLGESTYDDLVPQVQMLEMQAADPVRTRTLLLPGSTVLPLNFTHASITPAALSAWQRAELELLKRAAARSHTNPTAS